MGEIRKREIQFGDGRKGFERELGEIAEIHSAAGIRGAPEQFYPGIAECFKPLMAGSGRRRCRNRCRRD